MFDQIRKFDRIFLVFTGNSINIVPPDMWEKLKLECTVGINHTFKVFSPTYLFFADKDVLYAYWKFYSQKEHRPIVYARNRSLYQKPDPTRYPEMIPQEWLDTHIDEWWAVEERITPKEFNITPIWLLSCLMEKRYTGKVYILGADFYVEDGKYHFQNYDLEYYQHRKLEVKLQEFKKMFEHPYFRGKLNIFNCNPKSNLKVFPFVDLKEILNVQN